jgi:hypothetical protein
MTSPRTVIHIQSAADAYRAVDARNGDIQNLRIFKAGG